MKYKFVNTKVVNLNNKRPTRGTQRVIRAIARNAIELANGKYYYYHSDIIYTTSTIRMINELNYNSYLEYVRFTNSTYN